MNISRAVSRISFFYRRYHQGRMFLRIAACAVMAAAFSAPQFASAANTSVRLITSLGTIDLQLNDDQAPITVANFLRYAGRGYYSTTTGTLFGQSVVQTSFFYRSVPGFVLQSGTYADDDTTFGDPNNTSGYAMNLFQHPADPPIPNEFSASNVTGTIAMAKVSGYPNSATSEWFINLANNSSIIDPNGQQIGLDYQNGGFTVFGNVINNGMTVVNAIASLPVLNESGMDPATGNPVNYPILNGSQYLTTTPWCSVTCTLPTAALGAIPVNSYDTTIGLNPSNLVFITSIPNVRSTPTIQGSGQFSGPGNLLMTFTADVDMTFVPGSVSTFDANTTLSDLAQFTPPPDTVAKFNDGIFQFTVTWTQGSNSRIITLHNDDPPTANHYYAYGPTFDNQAPHWYDFTYDGTTGAEIVGNKILLHFVDGQRGDDDLTANSRITHTGAPALLSVIPNTTQTSVGCSIAATPSPMRNGGDWIVVSMFLTFVALVRRRNRLDRIETARH